MKNKLPVHFILSVLASLLFFLAHPNPVFKNGLGFLGYFIYLPVFLIIYSAPKASVWLWGGIFGALSHLLLAHWLFNYHFLTLILVCVLYFFCYGVLFLLLRLIHKLFAQNAYIVWWICVCAFEYVKTLGFLGFSYGITAYSQWKYTAVIQTASVFGVFGLNLLMIFPSCLGAKLIAERKMTRSVLLAGSLWCAFFAGNLIFGAALNTSAYKKNVTEYNMVAVQNNESPWKNGLEEHRKNIEKLMSLTDSALQKNPETDFVVWPETAVAPSIMRHFYGMEDLGRLELILNLLNYINKKDCVFVIGNAHEEISDGNKKIFNDAMVFEPKKNVIPPNPYRYTKRHLVPVSESFPYKKQFPHIYDALLHANTHFWEEGQEYTVFDVRGLKFSTPICFEDTFGADCRIFVKNGAKCFINLSNDSWSESLSCQNQHLAMAVFRSVENGVPSVRSTSSGQTCIISMNGKVESCAPAFEESYCTGKIRVPQGELKQSAYTKYGDFMGIIECGCLLVLLLIKGIVYIIGKRQGNLKKSRNVKKADF